MKTKTVTVLEGEWLEGGDLDSWLAAHAAARDVPQLTVEQVASLRRIMDACIAGRGVSAEFSHSSVDFKILRVGVYDGWVYWRPRLCLLVEGTLGCEVREGYDLGQVFDLVPCVDAECVERSHRWPCRGFRRVS